MGLATKNKYLIIISHSCRVLGRLWSCANRDKMLNLETCSHDRTQTRQETIKMSCILAANTHTVIDD